ncbi:PsiF family protein [Sabulicella rubraurantiaca]|uniref:PsiF family protein n=1 Tax=Sabulicella rubraurantiaca TaxID=2811429 RepID=UPI001A965060|nr:PsiF family protein [Sabulicella rubraurantiaca]
MLRLLSVVLLVATPALAETRQPSPAQRAQQERMRSCNAEAKSRSLSGEQRQGFMRSCLRGQSTGATPQPM